MSGDLPGAVSVKLDHELYEAVSDAAAALDLATSIYVRSLIRRALARGIADELVRQGVDADKSRVRSRATARIRWEATPGERQEGDAPIVPPNVYRHGPFTLRRLGRNIARGAGETDGWWLEGPEGATFLGPQRTPARHKADELVRIHESREGT